jgi:hypothetical protein
MSLPNADRAVVDPAKIRDYLLATAHPAGRFKARFFVSLGYAADQWERLRDDILGIARSGSIAGETAASYGRKFEVDGIHRSVNSRLRRLLPPGELRRWAAAKVAEYNVLPIR